jgi:hypothetical protein
MTDLSCVSLDIESVITLNSGRYIFNTENGNNKLSDKYNNIESSVVAFDKIKLQLSDIECAATMSAFEDPIVSEIVTNLSEDLAREVDDMKQQSSILKIAYSAILFFSIIMSVGATLLFLPQTTVIQKHFGFLAFSGGLLAIAFLAYDGLQNGWRHNQK